MELPWKARSRCARRDKEGAAIVTVNWKADEERRKKTAPSACREVTPRTAMKAVLLAGVVSVYAWSRYERLQHPVSAAHRLPDALYLVLYISYYASIASRLKRLVRWWNWLTLFLCPFQLLVRYVAVLYAAAAARLDRQRCKYTNRSSACFAFSRFWPDRTASAVDNDILYGCRVWSRL